MRIGEREIGLGHPPYCVAELSGEHKGRIALAYDLILAARNAGADAAKLQCFEPDRLVNARGGNRVLKEGLWAGCSLLELYNETYTPREWFPELFAYAKEIGITLFSSVFDEEGVDYLESLGCPAYKIASFELTDLALIRKAASTGKPIIISTGMGNQLDVWKAVSACEPANVALLHCISSYPCAIADANLKAMRLLPSVLPESIVGLSDHTLGSIAPVVATALGASIIEKHITLDRKNGGPDAAFSLEPAEFAKMVQDVKDAYASLGTGQRPESEAPYRELRRKG